MATAKKATAKAPAKKAPAKKAIAAKTAVKRPAGKRELLTPHKGGPSEYMKRKPGGQFAEGDDVGRSQMADKRVAAKKTVQPGFGDQGDQRKPAKHASAAKKASK